MDLTHTTTPKLEAWRQEVATWLDAEFSPKYASFAWDYDESEEVWAYYRDFWRKLGAKRWLQPTWPKEYGGSERSAREEKVFLEELEKRRITTHAGIGPAVSRILFRLGTQEQKATFLTGIASGDILWAEGYTEPNAGSDLASLSTRAVRDGSDWLITGQKTFVTAGDRCEWIILAVRTDPDALKKHDGISYFVAPADSPGISFQALWNYADGRQNHVFLDELRVPQDRLIGELNEGWRQVWFGIGGDPLPSFEHSDPGPESEYEPVHTGRFWDREFPWILEQMVEYCRETKRNGAPLSQDPIVRMQLTELAISVEAQKMLNNEQPCEYGNHLHQAIEREFLPELAQTCMEILGPLGQIQSGKWAPLKGEIDRLYRRSFGNHAGGTAQLKRMVVATRALGLPR